MHCVYTCPEDAIKPRILGLTVMKDGYDINKIISNDDISGDYVKNGTKGFYKHFLRYLSNIEI
jgi:hypothetical protein